MAKQVMAGGSDDGATIEHFLASAEVLAADGSGWAAVAPMSSPRACAAAGLLPNGRVIVVGGQSAAADASALASAEQWGPATCTWSSLPPMAAARSEAACCVLADGRFAVVGGVGAERNWFKH